MKPLATLYRSDGTRAELHADGWRSRDARWAELLNLRFDPRLRDDGDSCGMPGYVHAVAAAAERFGCTARYPWSDSRLGADVIR